MRPAERVMREFNRNALVYLNAESETLVFIEDVQDPDERWYRMEYESTWDGNHAVAYCRYDPWQGNYRGRSTAGGHLMGGGLLCLGPGVTPTVPRSPFTLDTAVRRARYWCIAFSAYIETGTFPNP